ncbi:hypothetical protein CCACVL1_06589 [Corchorus capsularis]|uniref:Uncharacterized protein n=1 Tax=Corchorus capsularis TaxID=210143 RepID=A0A1R3JEH0_COCAP|nr:hypothetical protein CCACVL1_06589 [Corchorus capsularis]
MVRYELTSQFHRVYSPYIPPSRRHYRVPSQIQLVEVTISVKLTECIRHYCSRDTSETLLPEHDQITRRFDLEDLKDHDLAYETLDDMLSELKFEVDIDSEASDHTNRSKDIWNNCGAR